MAKKKEIQEYEEDDEDIMYIKLEDPILTGMLVTFGVFIAFLILFLIIWTLILIFAGLGIRILSAFI